MTKFVKIKASELAYLINQNNTLLALTCFGKVDTKNYDEHLKKYAMVTGTPYSYLYKRDEEAILKDYPEIL